MPTAGLATDLPDGWEWDYDGTRWFYTFKANGHVQYHFPSDGDEFPDFVGVVPAALEPEERLASHQQVKRATGAPPERKKKSKDGRGNGMTATTPRPVGIEWDGDVGAGSSEDEEGDGEGAGSRVVFEPENLMFLGPQTYAEVSPLNEEEEEAAKRTVVGEKGAVVSPGKETPATSGAEECTKEGENGHVAAPRATTVLRTPAEDEKPLGKKEEPAATHEAAKPVEEPTKSLAPQKSACEADPVAEQNPALATEEVASSLAPRHESTASPPLPPPLLPPGSTHTLAVELPVPAPPPFNPVGIIAEMPTEDTPRSHIEMNPIPVEIMDASVLAPIETAPSLGVAELPGQGRAPAAAVVKQTQQTQMPQSGVAITKLPPMQMKIKRKPTDPNASIPSPKSASSSALMSPSAVSHPSVTSSSPASLPAPVATQYNPWAPVSPLLRADTEPATPRPAMITAQQKQRAMTAPPSPVANPQLSYAPMVLRPAGRRSRQSTSVSPERKEDRSGTNNGESGLLATAPAEKPAQGGTVTGASPRNASAAPGMSEGQMRPLGQEQPPDLMAQRGEMTARSHLQLQGHGPPQRVSSQPNPTFQPVQMPPAQMPLQKHRRPVSMAPGQYPPVPIPQPYNQYHSQPPRIVQHPGPPWLAPGQPIPSPGRMMPPVQQQPPPGWMRQSMPPAYPPGQQPPNGRHSLTAQSDPRLIPLRSHYHPAPSSTSTPSEPPASQSRRRSSTADSLAVSPLRPRADSQPLGIVLPSPSPLETPQTPAAAPIPHKDPTPGSAEVGMGSGTRRRSTADSYFPLSKERSAGHVGDIADQFAAEMQAILGSGSEVPVANLATAKPEPKALVGTWSLGAANMLDRIEEHQAGNTPISASPKQDLRPSSVATDLTQSTLQSTASQPQPPAPSKQTSPSNMLQAPQGFLSEISRKPVVYSHGAQAGMPLPGQMAPRGHGRQGSMLRQGVAPQQQWQSNMQQPTQRLLSVPSQTHVQPSQSKENKWTKWFKTPKPEKKLSTLQIGMPQLQQPPPQGWMQPQQWQPGAPIPGHASQNRSIQGQSMQGQPIQGQALQGQPIQGQIIPGQPAQGQPMQSTLIARPMSLQSMPMNPHPPHQIPPGQGGGPTPMAMAQQGPLGSHPPQQYMPLQPGQPTQMRKPFGAPNEQMRPGEPMMQMQPLGVAESPAQTTPLQHLQKPLQNRTWSSQQTGQPAPQSEGPTVPPTTNHLMPAPLSLRPKPEVSAGIRGAGLSS
ncbi:hypothetical protein G3M48_000123 [Beauveria asiatica]|uniref:WW domain-containing protein n=1 Tax=Beauveria asiatica TaxID=1069075 RepID=A0AAW0RGW1_9HYPO